MRRQIVLVAAYLTAIVLANLTAAWWGPQWTIINALLFIGLDLSARDGLHELWGRGWHLTWRLGALIVAGSVISWALNRDAGRIALASTVAFAAAALVDSLVFKWAHRLDRQDRANASNIVAAAVDSILFPTIAFGSFMLDVTVGQWGAKVAGGAIWVWVLWGWRRKNAAAAAYGTQNDC